VEILYRVHGLLSDGTSVVIMWVASHVGLSGNFAACIAVKVTLFLPESNLTVPHSDYNSLIRTQALKQCNYVGILKLKTSCM